jgi:hypothetical protein
MANKRNIAAMLIALALLGCKGAQPTLASSGDGDGNGGSSGAAVSPGSGVATKVAYIPDPTLNNMNAFSVKIPSRWQFQGTLFQGDTCEITPMPIYRATSPDGLSMAEQEPPTAWQWGTGPAIGMMPKGDCLPFNGPMSAQDFLKHFAMTMKMNYVGDDPVPAALNAKAQQAVRDGDASVAGQYAARHMQPPKNTRELARVIVTYQKGTAAMKGRLDTIVNCSESNAPGQPQIVGRPPRIVTGPPSTVNKCTATVRFITAPEAKFAEVVRGWDAYQMGANIESPWSQAWIQRNAQQTQRTIAIMGEQSREFMRGQQEQFERNQAARQNMHDQFMQSMNEQGERNTQNFINHENARDTETSDFVDYTLDRRTVQDTNTGIIYKQSVTAPVDGSLQQVHGNGSPW